MTISMDTMGPFTRREWLAGTFTLLTAGCASRRTKDRADEIETVTGPVAGARLGVTLMHEHVLVDFIGAAQVSPSRYDADAVFTAVLPHLQQVKRLGCETLVECTPAYLGRDPRLLRRLSAASGLNILSNTGYYGAANDKHLPEHAFHETADGARAAFDREVHGGGLDAERAHIGPAGDDLDLQIDEHPFGLPLLGAEGFDGEPDDDGQPEGEQFPPEIAEENIAREVRHIICCLQVERSAPRCG